MRINANQCESLRIEERLNMKIYDISQEVFGCAVFPGDPSPEFQRVKQTAKGDIYNLTEISMCVHNGTHIDAPFHFYEQGKKVDELDLRRMVGRATVATLDGDVTAQNIKDIFRTYRNFGDRYKRLLIKGKAVVTLEAAREMNRQGVGLVGVESQTVGPEAAPAEVHYELLGEEVVLLEGLRLTEVPDGEYLLSALPINLGGADGAPCRAVLIK